MSQASEPLKTMLIVDREVDPHGDLVQAVLPEVVIIKYDSKRDTLSQLIMDVERVWRQNHAQFKIIGFANHGGPVWQIAQDLQVRPEKRNYLQDVMPIIKVFVKILTRNGGRIDLLGCHLLEEDPKLCDKLEKQFPNVNFTASDDKTGNVHAGGDWLMESDGNLDVTKDYFDSNKLDNYKEVMNYSLMDGLDFVPVVGTVARTGEAGYCLAIGDTEGAKEAAMNASLNAAGDALGVVTGGSGKVAMTGARVAGKAAAKAGAKAALKQGVKGYVNAALRAGSKAFLKSFKKSMTKEWWKSYAKKYLKKKIKKEFRNQVKEVWDRFEQDGELPAELGPVIACLSDATGMTQEEVQNMDQNDLLMCFASIAYLPDSDPSMEGAGSVYE